MFRMNLCQPRTKDLTSWRWAWISSEKSWANMDMALPRMWASSSNGFLKWTGTRSILVLRSPASNSSPPLPPLSL